MKTKSISFFSYPKEITALIETKMALEDIRFARLEKRDEKYFIEKLSVEQALNAGREVWLVPASLESPASSILGLIQLVLPHLKDGQILMGALSIKTNEQRFNLLKNFEELRRSIDTSFKSGVWAMNNKFGGEAYYADIYVSPAVKTLNSEIVLLPRYGEGNVSYSLSPKWNRPKPV